MKSIGVVRGEYCRSYFLTDLINLVHTQLHLFDRVLNAL
jgi:hypothetical protein